MIGWLYRLNGHLSEKTPGVGDAQEGLSVSVLGVAKIWTWLSHWTDWLTDKSYWIKAYPSHLILTSSCLLRPYLLPWWLSSKEPDWNTGDVGSILRLGRSLGKEMATHSSILAPQIPWTEKPGRLQPMGWQRARRDYHYHLQMQSYSELASQGKLGLQQKSFEGIQFKP